MNAPPPPLNVIVAQQGLSSWADELAGAFARLPVSLHWPRTGEEALGLAATRRMHVAVVDEDLPDSSGCQVVRGIRRLGLALPCFLVCSSPDPRLLREAIALEIYSVLEAESLTDMLTPMLLRAVRQVYDIDWLSNSGVG